jgi:hypothetical protein
VECSPEELGYVLSVHYSPVLITLFIAAVPTLIAPILSLLLSGAALCMCFRYHGWVRKIAIVEVAIGICLLVFFGITGVLHK